jgi:hypothetical protein
MPETRKKRRKTSIGGAFAPRLIEMMRSPAFGVLSLSARRILDRIEIELGDHGGTENGKLPVTFDDFHRFGIDRHSIAPGIREVVALGFVEITRHGRAGNSVYRTSNEFRLTYRHTDYADPTHEWRRIKSPEDAATVASAARKSVDQKYNSNRRKIRIPVGETNTVSVGGNASVPVGEAPTTVVPGKPPLLTISPSRFLSASSSNYLC